MSASYYGSYGSYLQRGAAPLALTLNLLFLLLWSTSFILAENKRNQ
jgi:hypothetical protein